MTRLVEGLWGSGGAFVEVLHDNVSVDGQDRLTPDEARSLACDLLAAAMCAEEAFDAA